jgi:hypothetical protein
VIAFFENRDAVSSRRALLRQLPLQFGLSLFQQLTILVVFLNL